MKLSFPTYNNTWHCFRTIVAQEGVRGRVLKSVSVVCVCVVGARFTTASFLTSL